MYVRITRGLVLTLCNHDLKTGEDESWQRVFLEGQVYPVGEVLPDGGRTTMEFHGLGYAEVPDDCWEEYPGPVYLFLPGSVSRN